LVKIRMNKIFPDLEITNLLIVIMLRLFLSTQNKKKSIIETQAQEPMMLITIRLKIQAEHLQLAQKKES
jgi:hypothetical protein